MKTTAFIANSSNENVANDTDTNMVVSKGPWCTGTPSYREGAVRRVNVLDVEMYHHFLTAANQLRDWGIDFAKLRAGDYQGMVMEDGPPNLQLLTRLEEHVNKSSPIFISANGLNAWDECDMAFWESLSDSEAEAIVGLLGILWVEGRIEIFCPHYESKAA